MKQKEQELRKEIERLYQECNVDISSLDEYKDIIILLMEKAKLEGYQSAKTETIKEIIEIIKKKHKEDTGINWGEMCEESDCSYWDLVKKIKKLGEKR